MPKDKVQKPRQSRVRGAEQIKERVSWPYPIGQFDWIEQLNFVRRKIGDRQVAVLTGVSLSDPTYKTVRRWAAGSRIPQAETYSTIVREYKRLQIKLVLIHADIMGSIIGEISGGYQSKVQRFLHIIKPDHIYRKEPEEGFAPSDEAAKSYARRAYIRACDKAGGYRPPSQHALILFVVEVVDIRIKQRKTEIHLIMRHDAPSLSLLKNAIDTWITDNMTKNTSYLAWFTEGVWFSYA